MIIKGVITLLFLIAASTVAFAESTVKEITRSETIYFQTDMVSRPASATQCSMFNEVFRHIDVSHINTGATSLLSESPIKLIAEEYGACFYPCAFSLTACCEHAVTKEWCDYKRGSWSRNSKCP